MDLRDIVRHFDFKGKYAGARQFVFGHINDTYIVYFNDSNACSEYRYILQSINKNVFTDPEKLMENIAKVTGHLQAKLIENGDNPRRETLCIVPTLEGKKIYQNGEGEFWRAYEYIEGTRSYQVVENPYHFYSAGRTIGKFQKLLSDYPAHNLYETIPDFHNTPRRYEVFLESLNRDVLERAQGACQEIDFLKSRADYISMLVNMLEKGDLPLRVIHNDTKFNNVLIDEETGEGVCLVDLDTVMPGSTLYDFGDAIRYGANRAGEDQTDLSKVMMDLDLYEKFCQGYLELARDSLSEKELDYLPYSAWLITLECGMRFLTDYLEGDNYFKTFRDGHNLDRARTQFKLVADMEEKYERMKSVINRLRKEDHKELKEL